MAKFICKCCGKEYKSNNKNSKYCSRECVSLAHHTQVELICEHCGKPFMMFNCFKDIQKFCSRKCYDQHRRENSKLKTIECPICHNMFRQTYVNQQYCSRECRGISDRKRVSVICAACGKVFERPLNAVQPDGHNYCSNACKSVGMFWPKEDIQILSEHYASATNDEMIKLLKNKYTNAQIKSRANYYGLTKGTEFWTQEEERIMLENYPVQPFKTVQQLLPNRSRSSILGKARTLGLLSYFYYSNTYSDEDVEFIKNNYNKKSVADLAHILGRSEKGIEQKIRNLGLRENTGIRKESYPCLSKFMRSRLITWTENVKKENDYTCCVTGIKGNVVIHHCRSFSLLFDETVDALNIPLYDNLSKYTDSQLIEFVDTFLDLQEFYGEYVCINEDVHRAFHRRFGYGYNTEEQWKLFVQDYNKTR